MVIDSKKVLKDIKELLKNIYRVKSYTEYSYLVMSINALIITYEELTGEILDLKVPTIEYYENILDKKYFTSTDINIVEYLNNRKEHTKLSKKIVDTFNKSNYIYYGREHSEKILYREEFFEIMEDFLKTFDDRLYKSYKKCVFNNEIDLDTDKYNYGDLTRIVYTKGNKYILLHSNPTIAGIDTFVHELSHYYEYGVLEKNSKRQMLYNDITYFEMYPHFVELAFFDYLKNINIYNKDVTFTENSFYHHYKEDFKDLYLYDSVPSEDINISASEEIGGLFIYSYSRWIATIMYERYLNDKKDTISRIDKYISLDGLISKNDQLEVLGISKKDIFDTKILAKRLQNHSKMLKKYS